MEKWAQIKYAYSADIKNGGIIKKQGSKYDDSTLLLFIFGIRSEMDNIVTFNELSIKLLKQFI